jgi:hypothetical protein
MGRGESQLETAVVTPDDTTDSDVGLLCGRAGCSCMAAKRVALFTEVTLTDTWFAGLGLRIQ